VYGEIAVFLFISIHVESDQMINNTITRIIKCVNATTCKVVQSLTTFKVCCFLCRVLWIYIYKLLKYCTFRLAVLYHIRTGNVFCEANLILHRDNIDISLLIDYY